MKKFIYVLLLEIISLFNIHAIGQTDISYIKSSYKEIKGKMSCYFYKQDFDQYKEIRSALILNVFDYYSLHQIYDSDLKKKIFKESYEYKQKLSEIQKAKTEIINSTYYLDFEPEYYERKETTKYDISTKRFSYTNEFYSTEKYNQLGFIQIDKILFKCPSGFYVKQIKNEHGGVDYIKETLSFRIENESMALKIEENSMNIKLLFLFSFTQALAFTNLDYFGIPNKDYYLMTKLKKVIVYNSSTNEIYAEFKPVSSQK